jgi:hypothetical protein
MKKVMMSLILAVGALFAVSLSAGAAPDATKYMKSGPFEGTFAGKVVADNGTSTELSLDLTHLGDEVEGFVVIGEGLYIDAGMCGKGYVPAGTQFARGEISSNNRNHLSAESQFKVSGLKVKVKLDGDASEDGDVMIAKAKIDLPWLCGGDPVISGTLYKA